MSAAATPAAPDTAATPHRVGKAWKREAWMRRVRALLLLGVAALVAGLFWDTASPAWTRPDGPMAWVWQQGPVVLRGHVRPATPYAIEARLLWTVLIPLLPLFFMGMGMNAWRRLCPLHLANQLPGYWGWRHVRQPGTGWWRRPWLVQVGLLAAALAARLLLIDSDRVALGAFLILVFLAAGLAGTRWAGRGWCHHVCPVNLVERIYTGPAGLFARTSGTGALPGSMCRTPGQGGGPDLPACDGCLKSCPDIDPARAYAGSLDDPDARLAYYALPGLIAGFFGYFPLYAGNVRYYFTGAWTHTRDPLAHLLGPGLAAAPWLPQGVGLPKLVAAPLCVLLAGLASWGLGVALESGLRRWSVWRGRPFDRTLTRHRAYCLAAFTAIVIFYAFSGRTTVDLLPRWGIALVDAVELVLPLLWLARALSWRPKSWHPPP